MTHTCQYVITQADDLGSSHSANRAIYESCKFGIIRNTSVMMNTGSVLEAAKLFAGQREICIGLHCTLNAEWDRVRWKPLLPASQVPSLVGKDGTFHKSPLELKEAGVNLGEIMAELQAQLDYCRSLGFQPVYADSHMRFEWIDEQLPKLFDDWCDSEGLISYRRLFRELPQPAHPIGDPVDRLMNRLQNAGPGIHGLLTHPAMDDEEIRQTGNTSITGEQVAAERSGDRYMLTHKRTLDYWRLHNIVPVTYKEMAHR